MTRIYADRSESRFNLAAGSSTDWVFFDLTDRLLARKLLVAWIVRLPAAAAMGAVGALVAQAIWD